MFKKVACWLVLATPLIVQSVLGQDLDKACDYLKFHEALLPWGIEWETHKVTTEDGYILTLFHLLNYAADDPYDRFIQKELSYNSVVFKNGHMADSSDWFGDPYHMPEEPMPLRYLGEGFDVWLADHRGVLYNQEHVSLSVE